MILIDMEMPENCMNCKFERQSLFSGNYCILDGDTRDSDWEKRPDWCPLKEVDTKAKKYYWHVNLIDGGSMENIEPMTEEEIRKEVHRLGYSVHDMYHTISRSEVDG